MLLNFSLVSAAAGFLISFVSGLLGGVAFLDILLRAFVWSIIFAGLGAGLAFLLQSQFPDLLDSTPSAPKDTSDSEATGSQVNIVLPEEVPDTHYEDDQGVEEIRENGEKASVGTSEVTAASVEDSAEPSSEDKVESQSMPVSPSSQSLGDSPLEGGDELPDLGAFADSFQTDEATEEPVPERVNSDEPAGPMGGSGESTVTFEGEEHDPEVMARAVRTALKRDQGGK